MNDPEGPMHTINEHITCSLSCFIHVNFTPFHALLFVPTLSHLWAMPQVKSVNPPTHFHTLLLMFHSIRRPTYDQTVLTQGIKCPKMMIFHDSTEHMDCWWHPYLVCHLSENSLSLELRDSTVQNCWSTPCHALLFVPLLALYNWLLVVAMNNLSPDWESLVWDSARSKHY